ncbi:MAG: hypothetical protein QNJ70_24380 [Xenococcaceae cyanobacterium MO_207.B15]|nr:hypothetical protein [Xenococcaceae cyanobacterium MO_207.B15]
MIPSITSPHFFYSYPIFILSSEGRCSKREYFNISIKFSAAFEKVAEEAAIARSQANKAEQELQRVKFEEQQKLARAEADKQVKVFEAQAQAESIRLQSEQLNRNPKYIELLEAQTKLKAAEGWNGQLPNYMGSEAIPFIQLPTSTNR